MRILRLRDVLTTRGPIGPAGASIADPAQGGVAPVTVVFVPTSPEGAP